MIHYRTPTAFQCFHLYLASSQKPLRHCLAFDAKTSFFRVSRPKLVRILVLDSQKPSSSLLLLLLLLRCRNISRSGLISVNPPCDHTLLLHSPHIIFLPVNPGCDVRKSRAQISPFSHRFAHVELFFGFLVPYFDLDVTRWPTPPFGVKSRISWNHDD